MLKRVIGATTTAVVALTTLTLATAAVAAPAASHNVLTTGKVGGPNVKVHAVLKASLAKGATAKFSGSGSSGSVTCKKSSFSDKVTKNPARPSTAHLSLTSQTFSSCTTTFGGATGVKSVKLNKLPYLTTISDRSGNPVKVFGVSTTITLNTVVGTLSCTYKAKHVDGSASNKNQVISFSKQPFTLSSGSSACPKKGSFSASYGPVIDSSVASHPHVFVS